jgi:hypothetical protein
MSRFLVPHNLEFKEIIDIFSKKITETKKITSSLDDLSCRGGVAGDA